MRGCMTAYDLDSNCTVESITKMLIRIYQTHCTNYKFLLIASF